MGIFTFGEPLDWHETKINSEQVHQRGIQQFVNLFHAYKHINSDEFKFGDEVEYTLIKFDHKHKRVHVLLKAHQLIPLLNEQNNKLTKWTPEFADFMLEGLPGTPYNHEIKSLLEIEQNMILRRNQVQMMLDCNEYVMTFSTFPQLGSPNFTYPIVSTTPHKGITKSMFFPDDCIFRDNPRYAISVVNNRQRRQAQMSANIPIYKDIRTPNPFSEDFSLFGKTNLNLKSDHIYMEGIGASCSCLQVTFQAFDLDEARLLYDQFIPMTPIVLALSAASPVWRGYLADIDCRWQVISEILDDRTPEEKGEIPLKNDRYRINKSRYDSVDCYLTELGSFYNDLDVVRNEKMFEYLLDQEVDPLMAQHISHLFIRDPIVLFRENLYFNDFNENERTEHFENIQSTNWQSMRFKPPPSCNKNSNIGWRVEFRTTELQVTDFENTAFIVFLVLLSRTILSYNINLLIPISKVDENMQRAHKRNAVINENFYFRTQLFNNNLDAWEEMEIDEILNGSIKFVGLIPLIRQYLIDLNVDTEIYFKLNNYLKLIEGKANGSIQTTATYMRDFIKGHKNYQFDSVCSNEITYDLMWNLYQIANNYIKCPQLTGSFA
jgi:glutamate--cysteine ligase catalytic subunit